MHPAIGAIRAEIGRWIDALGDNRGLTGCPIHFNAAWPIPGLVRRLEALLRARGPGRPAVRGVGICKTEAAAILSLRLPFCEALHSRKDEER